MPAISIIITNYNGKNLLAKHLPAVIACMRKQDELIVVDDASADGSATWIKKNYPKIKIIINNNNLRFAASANRGVEAANNDLIFLLNNDVSPKKDCLKHLLVNFNEHKKMFAVSCLEYESHNKNIKAGKNKLWFEKGLFMHSKAVNFKSGPTAWAAGGSAMFDKQKWQELGGFSKKYYPAYWEDIDLSFRAKQKGWQVLFEEKAIVYHQHESTNSDVFGQNSIEIMSWRNALIFAWEHMSAKQALQHLFFLPYHLLITNKKTKGNFYKGFFKAIQYVLFSDA